MVLKKDVLCLNDCYAVHDERRSRSIARKERKSAVVADDSKFQKRFGYLVRRKLRTSLLDGSSPCSRRCTIGLSGDRDRCRHLRNALRGEVGWEITLLDPHQSAKGLDAILFTDSKTVIGALKDIEPHVVRIGWACDHLEQWSRVPWLQDFELVFTASQSGADELFRRRHVRCHTLPSIRVQPRSPTASFLL